MSSKLQPIYRKHSLQKLIKFRRKALRTVDLQGKSKDKLLAKKIEYIKKVDEVINKRQQALPYRIALPHKKQKELGIFNGTQYIIT